MFRGPGRVLEPAHCQNGLITNTISWGNSDEGFDLWGSSNTRIEHSYTFGNGVNRWEAERFNGNGFKLGNCDSRATSRTEMCLTPELDGSESAAEALALFADSDFLRLAAGSDLIDAGEHVGESFSGAAPDLGAFER